MAKKNSQSVENVVVVENNVVANPLATLDAMFKEAGMNTASSKEKSDEYQKKTLTGNRIEGEVINRQHENWSAAYQAQRTAAVKLGQFRTAVMGLPKGCRKFSQGKFKTTQVWESIKDTIDAEQLERYLAMEAAVEALV